MQIVSVQLSFGGILFFVCLYSQEHALIALMGVLLRRRYLLRMIFQYESSFEGPQGMASRTYGGVSIVAKPSWRSRA